MSSDDVEPLQSQIHTTLAAVKNLSRTLLMLEQHREVPFPTRHPRKGEEVVFVQLRWWNKLVLCPVLPTPGVTSGHCVCNSSVTLGRFQHEEHETYPAVLEEGPGGDPVVFLPGGGVS